MNVEDKTVPGVPAPHRRTYSSVVLRELVRTDFKLRYQGSFLGVAWSVIKPLMLFAVMYVVFVRFLKFTDGTPHFPLVLLLGITLWNFFAEATTMGMQSVVGHGDLLRKIHFPNYIIVVAATMNSMISLAINLVVVIVFCLFSRVEFTWRVLLAPFGVIELYALAVGIALVLATLNVYFRDIQHIWEVVMQALFYGVPIIYPLSMAAQVSPAFAKFILIDPVAQSIQDVRWALIAPQTTPTTWNYVNTWWIKTIPVAIVLAVLALGVGIFEKHSRKFAEIM
ncbi:ABC transporter permease [uncultured Bifidobacterium sp.]|uniref:ABC transporter permease n=1 Tax=uncultured Bifidobacterium sp. TaxID=165187 RepID=UPI0028DCD2B4|nr:ABC transporter permease [uncultured Bifidobacterium sp.]